MYMLIASLLFFCADVPKGQEFDISNLLGFIITICVAIYLMVTNVREALRLKRNRTQSVGGGSANRTKDDLEKLFEDFFEKEELEEKEMSDEEEIDVRIPQTVNSSSQKKRWTQEAEHFVFHSSIDDFTQKTKIEDRELGVHLREGDELISNDLKLACGSQTKMVRKKKNTLEELFKKHPAQVNLLLASEIMQPPVGLRSQQTRVAK